MSGMLRTIKRQKDRDSDELPLAQQRLPTGRILTEPAKGKFMSVAMIGWIGIRERDRIPLVMLVVGLLPQEAEQVAPLATLEIELPLYGETMAATVAALERYGWSGQTWTEGDNRWPTGSEDEHELAGLLAQVGLRATFTFPPDAVTGDVRAQAVEVTRASGRFLMPPLEEPTEPPDPERVKALNELAAAYLDFYPTLSDA